MSASCLALPADTNSSYLASPVETSSSCLAVASPTIWSWRDCPSLMSLSRVSWPSATYSSCNFCARASTASVAAFARSAASASPCLASAFIVEPQGWSPRGRRGRQDGRQEDCGLMLRGRGTMPRCARTKRIRDPARSWDHQDGSCANPYSRGRSCSVSYTHLRAHETVLDLVC